MAAIVTRPRSASALGSIGEYRLEAPIAGSCGAGGLVRMGRSKRDPCARVVVKELLMSSPRSEHVVQREVAVMEAMRHHNTMSLLHSYQHDDRMFIVMRYAEKGDLFNKISSQPHSRLNMKEAKRCFAQIVAGVEYMHSEGYVHGDIKPDNLFLDENEDVLLGDFGRSCMFEAGEKRIVAAAGTMQYAAPEAMYLPATQRWENAQAVFEGMGIRGGRRGVFVEGPELDMWALGATLYVMVTGCFAFGGRSHEEVITETLMTEPSYPFYLPCDCVQLLRGLLTKDPARRWTLAQVKRSAWLKDAMVALERPAVAADAVRLQHVLETARTADGCALLRCSPRAPVTPRAVAVHTPRGPTPRSRLGTPRTALAGDLASSEASAGPTASMCMAGPTISLSVGVGAESACDAMECEVVSPRPVDMPVVVPAAKGKSRTVFQRFLRTLLH